jgi:hypothetical protein
MVKRDATRERVARNLSGSDLALVSPIIGSHGYISFVQGDLKHKQLALTHGGYLEPILTGQLRLANIAPSGLELLTAGVLADRLLWSRREASVAPDTILQHMVSVRAR